MATTPGRDATAQPTTEAGASTPRSAQRRPALTPLVSRARSADPSSGRRSIHTPATGGARAPGSSNRQGFSASGRKTNAAANATPHARAAFRALDSRRAAIFTPGKSRRRSLREQRETPRDILRNLSRVLAPSTQPVASSSSSPGPKIASDIGTIFEDDEDDFPIDRPRLSLPIDVDEDDSDLQPHRSAGLEDDNFTLQSIELPRRALSEQPRRMSRSSLGSVRLSDYIGGNDLGSDDVGIDSAFFPAGPFDDIPEEEEAVGDMTYERIDDDAARRATLLAGRESGFGVIDALDANDSTVFLAPQLQSSPARPSLHPEEEVSPDPVPFGEVDDEEDEDLEDDAMDATGLGDVQVEEATAKDAARKGKKRKRGVKVSRYGVEYPSLPPGVVKRLAQTFAQTSGVGKAKISPDTLNTIMQASDWFFEQLGDDLQAYAKHAGRKTIDESDVLTLMRRQRQTSSVATPFSLAQRHLPRELLQELRMTPPAPVKQRRKRNVSRGADAT